MEKGEYDVVVAGGGPAGIGAAVGAAGLGLRVLLLERYPILGGMGTVALVNNFCNAHYDGFRLIIGGVFGKIRDRLLSRDSLFVTGGLEPFNHHVYLEELHRILEEAGVEVMLNSGIESLVQEDGKIVRLILSGGRSVTGKTFVDATGDANLATMAGVEFTFGRDHDGAVMPLTWCYLLGPLDRDRLRAFLPSAFMKDLRTGEEFIYMGSQPELKERVKLARERGELTIPRDRIAVAYSMPGYPNSLSVNFGRVHVKDPTDPEEMKKAEEIGLRQVQEGVRFFQRYVPGFENAEVQELARQIGVRESRQIVGLYRLTGEDVLQGRQFEDVIAQCCYSVDIHDPVSDTTVLRSLPKGTHYDIPLRCLIPVQGPQNLIVGGRSISATQEAMSSFRVSPSAMAIGEAAGVAAGLTSRLGCPMREVPYDGVRKVLLENGGILE